MNAVNVSQHRNAGANVKVAIIDCEKAGLIGGPFRVEIIKNGAWSATRSGIKSIERANEVRDEYVAMYKRQGAEVVS